jgi:hypothetical protein
MYSNEDAMKMIDEQLKSQFVAELSTNAVKNYTINFENDSESSSYSSPDSSDLEKFIRISKSMIDSEESSGDLETVDSGIFNQHDDMVNKVDVQGTAKEILNPVQVMKARIKTKISKDNSSREVHEMNRISSKGLCDICGKFLTKCYLRLHIVTVHEKSKIFHCDVCSRTFYSKKSIKRHLFTHLKAKKAKNFLSVVKERLFKCVVVGCNYSSTNKYGLKNHQTVHTGEVEFFSKIISSN